MLRILQKGFDVKAVFKIQTLNQHLTSEQYFLSTTTLTYIRQDQRVKQKEIQENANNKRYLENCL